MNNKKDILPLAIAFCVALVVTGIIKWIMPSGSPANNQQKAQNELSMPDIPLMVKEDRKRKENQVLIVSKMIKKDRKVTIEYLTWKKWPQDAIQPSFIAKDEHETAINNKTDYDNALKMWAISDIPAEVPLTMSMLTNEDPKKREADRKKKEEEAKKKQEKKERDSFIGKGMRAVTFAIDQKSASSSSMLAPDDLVDVLIMEQRGERVKTYKYKALKILAIDGVTKFEQKKQKSNDSLLNGLSVGLLSPKNITLEIKETLVEEMLKRAGNAGIILSLRSQNEVVKETDRNVVETENSSEKKTLLQNIISLNHNSSEILRERQKVKEIQEKTTSTLINNMNSIGETRAAEALMMAKKRKKLDDDNLSIIMKSMNSLSNNDGASENMGYSESKKSKSKKHEDTSVIIYRELKTDEIQFDEDGKKKSDASKDSAATSKES